MRILIVTTQDYDPPWMEGVSNIIRCLVRYLSNNGDIVNIISVSHSKVPHKIGDFGELIYYVTPNKFRLITHFDILKHIIKLENNNAIAITLVFTSASSLFTMRACLYNSFLKSKVVYYVSGLKYPRFGFNLFRKSPDIMVGSPFLRRWFPLATLVYPLVSVNRQESGSFKRLKKADEPFTLFYLGTMQKERGVEFLLKGISIARHQTSRPLKVILAFNGIGKENAHNIFSLIHDLKLTDIVTIEGIIDTDVIYKSADVLIIPRQDPIRMSFPVRIIEALSYRKPVIVTTICDMGQLIEGCGLVVKPDIPNDMANAICRLSDNGDLYNELSDYCETKMQEYDPDKVFNTMYYFLRKRLSLSTNVRKPDGLSSQYSRVGWDKEKIINCNREIKP